LCNLIDARAKVNIAEIDSSDDSMLQLVSTRLKGHKDYPKLQKEWDVLEKKVKRKIADNEVKINKLKDELNLITAEKDEVRIKINLIGIVPSTGLVLHESKWVGRSYKDHTTKVVVQGENETLWKGILHEQEIQKVAITREATSTKEKIWLAETREEAETLIKE
jgi:hypothetical protein